MIQTTFYGHIGEKAHKIVPLIWKLATESFCTILLNGEGGNDVVIHLTREQAQVIYNGLGRELAAIGPPAGAVAIGEGDAMPVPLEPLSEPGIRPIEVEDDIPF